MRPEIEKYGRTYPPGAVADPTRLEFEGSEGRDYVYVDINDTGNVSLSEHTLYNLDDARAHLAAALHAYDLMLEKEKT